MAPQEVRCPHCKRPVEWSAENPYRPFCSERCRLLDLGAWLSEEHAIPGPAQDAEGAAPGTDAGEKPPHD